MSVLGESIELIAQYRELITSAEHEPVKRTLRGEAEDLWDQINVCMRDIPAGHEELNTGKLSVRGFAFPFRARRVKFGNALPAYSAGALAREMHGWNTSLTIDESIAAITDTAAKADGNLTEPLRELFRGVKEPLKATPDAPVAYVDLETTGPHPAVSEIIECGMIVDYGTHEDEYSELYDIRDKRAIVDGELPFSDCHHITPEMIDGKPEWAHASEIHEILADPKINVVAHHIDFEARWFAHTVPEFMDVRSPYFSPLAETDNAPRMFDSRFAAAFISDAERGTLQSLVEAMGAEYVDAHRALNDVTMMKAALKKL